MDGEEERMTEGDGATGQDREDAGREGAEGSGIVVSVMGSGC